METVGFLHTGAQLIIWLTIFAFIKYRWPQSWAGRAIGAIV